MQSVREGRFPEPKWGLKLFAHGLNLLLPVNNVWELIRFRIGVNRNF
ncbi:hypothetical protein [Cylindrospermopsis raciborskii]|nr:hypothetical protein [Cylindrospermopsis raciborskii]